MHRLQFSKQETDLLAEYLIALGQSPGDKQVGFMLDGSDLLDLLSSIKTDLSTAIEHKYIYESIKRKVEQCYWQVMYHTPLSRIPLLINDTSVLIVTIAKWRLDIAK